ncbi:MAG: efflux RND transporter periplasmic adaptor subunit [Tannerellaceae bacterium]|nr:efflux RND transporter periplasmic adaptor subunit [Tannerellaceae bacterium]
MIQKQFYFALLILVFTACSSGTTHEESVHQTSVNSSFLPNVEVVTVEIANQRTEMTLTGKVISDPDRTITYAPLVSGIVEKAYFSLGDKVRKGQVLLDIRSTELSALESELISLQTQVTIAERAYDSARSLYEDGMLSGREYLEAEGEVKQAEAELARVKADISVYGTSKGRGVFAVTAPMDGYIVSKGVSSGSTLTADGDPLFTIADLSSVWIIANVYASNLLFVKEGMEVAVSTLSYPGHQFPGYITALSQAFDPEDKALKARIIMDNKDLLLKPEMSAVITLKEEVDIPLVAVPSEALIFDDNTYFVVVQNGTGDFSNRNVQLQGHAGSVTYLSEGLQPGEQVVVRNQLLIYAELKGK